MITEAGDTIDAIKGIQLAQLISGKFFLKETLKIGF